MHSSTFQYLKPTDHQLETMSKVREAADTFAKHLIQHLPDGPDKTHTIRKFREVAMWANVAITRHYDGSPRVDYATPEANHGGMTEGVNQSQAGVGAQTEHAPPEGRSIPRGR